MKRISVLAAIAGWTVVGAQTARADPPGSSWQLVFDDEFDDTDLDPKLGAPEMSGSVNKNLENR